MGLMGPGLLDGGGNRESGVNDQKRSLLPYTH